MTEKDHPSIPPESDKGAGGRRAISPEEARRLQLDQIRGMELLPKELQVKLPELYSDEGLGMEAIALVKYFTPDSSWSWFASEGSPVDEDGYFDTDKEKVDYYFFGLVSGFELELGYFSLNELRSIQGPLGLPIERDLYYEPKSLRELKAYHDKLRGGGG